MTSIPNMFAAAKANHTNANSPVTKLTLGRGIALPAGADASSLHQQGIQKNGDNGFVVSGSASATGYLYVANNGVITNVTTRPTLTASTNPPLPQIVKYNDLNHFGGFQISGDILAVGCENANLSPKGGSVVLFFRVSDLTSPTPMPLRLIERQYQTAGAVGICNYDNGWIVAVGNYNCERVDFYTITSNAGSVDGFVGGELAWKGSWVGSEPLGPGSVDQTWPTGSHSYQNLNLFYTKADGLWMIGMGQNGQGEDWADLYQITFDNQNGIMLVKSNNAHYYCSGGPGFINGSGFALDPTQQTLQAFAISKHMSSSSTVANTF